MASIWDKYLTLAYKLANTDKEEYLRSAISRAYYSVFHKVKLSSGQNTKREKVDVHKEFISKLRNPDEKLAGKLNLSEAEIMLIGNELDEFRKTRNNADYEAFMDDISPRFVSKTLERAELILEILRGDYDEGN
ncbi:MAG: hypothetical protein HC831_07925 [Chloroflexia bacterium]|nr:hypothetical protein [Chloroflexia bacterium]